MTANTNDGSGLKPRLRGFINLGNLEDLPAFSTGPHMRDPEARFRAIHQAGYEGVQGGELKPAEIEMLERIGLGRCAGGRINEPKDADGLAARMAAQGHACLTIHLGWGMEDEAQGSRLIEAMLTASQKYRLPIYPETHRATLFQDTWRTVQFVKRFPEIRFNGDFSHWYTGLEMVYGGFENKLAFIAPVLERVRFLHGRIGNPGCMQVSVGDANPEQYPFVAHFRQLWIASIRSFLKTAAQGDYMIFAPELLASRIYYARLVPDSGGQLREESDRWEQALVLTKLARSCFAEASSAA